MSGEQGQLLQELLVALSGEKQLQEDSQACLDPALGHCSQAGVGSPPGHPQPQGSGVSPALGVLRHSWWHSGTGLSGGPGHGAGSWFMILGIFSKLSHSRPQILLAIAPLEFHFPVGHGEALQGSQGGAATEGAGSPPAQHMRDELCKS